VVAIFTNLGGGLQQIQGPVGDSSTPGFTFFADTTTGMSLVAGFIDFIVGGSEVLLLSSAAGNEQALMANGGSVAAPSYSFAGDEDTGMYSPGSDVLALAAGGTDMIVMDQPNNKVTITGTVDPIALILSDPALGTSLFFESFDGQTAPDSGLNTGRIRYNDATGTFQISTQGSVYADISTGGGVAFPLLAPDGSAAAPSYSFSSETDSGFYYDAGAAAPAISDGSEPVAIFTNLGGVLQQIQGPAGDSSTPGFTFIADTTTGMSLVGGDITFIIGGTSEVLLLTAAGGNEQVLGPDGSVAAPSYSFAGDQSKGIYSPATDELAFVTAGAEVMRFTATQSIFSVPILEIDGSAAAPSYTFTSDVTTGMFLNGAGDIGFSAGGAGVFNVFTGGIQVNVDNGYRALNQTSAAAANTGTLLNAPSIGDPAFWLRIHVDGTDYAAPLWTV